MNMAGTLKWLLLITVAASLFVLFQEDEVPKKTGATGSPLRAQSSVPRDSANEEQFKLGSARNEDWPRQQVGANYGWEPMATRPTPVAKVATANPPSSLPALDSVVLVPTPVQELTVSIESEPPPKPIFPYRFVGVLQQETSVWAWLVGSNGTRAVVQNQMLDGNWRVEAIGTGGVSVRHLPTDYALQITYKP